MLAVLALLGGGGALVVWGGDLALRRLYGHWKPLLELPLTQLLGHPVALGPYQGLGRGMAW